MEKKDGKKKMLNYVQKMESKQKDMSQRVQNLELRVKQMEQELVQYTQIVVKSCEQLMQQDEKQKKNMFQQFLQSASAGAGMFLTKEYINIAYERCLVEKIPLAEWFSWCQKYIKK